MKRIAIVMAMIMGVVMMFSGCADIEQTVDLAKDKIKVTQDILFDKEYIDNLKKDESINTTDIIYINQYMQAAKVVEIDGKQYYKIHEVEDTAYDEFIGIGNASDSEVTYATNEVFYHMMPKAGSLIQETLDSLSTIKIDWTKITSRMIVTFQAPIVSTNGTIDKDNPNKVVFESNSLNKDAKELEFASTNKDITLASVEKMIKDSNTLSKPSIKKIKANKVKKKAKTATITVKWKKVKGANIYYVLCAKKKNFKDAIYKSTKKTSITIKKLKKKKTYYVKMYAEKENFAGYDVESKYSKTKKIKTKK